MSLLLYCGFDYFNTSQTNRIWPYVVGNGAIVTPGRIGGQGYGFTNVGTASYIGSMIPNSTTVIVGIAFNFSVGDATNPFLILEDATASRVSPTPQMDLRVTTDNAFQVTRNGTILGTTADALFGFNLWNYLELLITISNSSGIIQLRVNGNTELNLTGLDTQNTSNNYVNKIRLQAFITGTATANFDDLYVANDAGSVNNTFLGECRVQTQYPSANGAENDFTAIGAGTNWQCVDETIMDDDTTYVKSGVVGNIDDYAMGTVSFTGTIFGVQVNVTQKKDDVGSRAITPMVRSGGTNYLGTAVTCQTDYLTAQHIFELNPNGNVAWTNTTINAMNAGLKVTG